MSKTRESSLAQVEEAKGLIRSDQLFPPDRSEFETAVRTLHALTHPRKTGLRPHEDQLSFISSPSLPMTSQTTTRTAALEERTLQFAANVRAFAKRLPRVVGSGEDVQQLLRSAAGIGASYIEANEAIGRTNFVNQIRTCLKESKESAFWLRLIDTGASEPLAEFKGALVKESRELMRIFFAILRKIRIKDRTGVAAH